QLSRRGGPLPCGPGKSSNAHWRAHDAMTSRLDWPPTRLSRSLSPLLLTILIFLTAACSKKETEAAPEVSVQVAPARTGDVSRIVTAEAVVSPLQQAVIAPKISSSIKSFEVQRGARVHKGQLLAVLENRDLSAAAEQSKG